jgi:hypothetical protein
VQSEDRAGEVQDLHQQPGVALSRATHLKCIVQKFSRPVMMLTENKYVYKAFWHFSEAMHPNRRSHSKSRTTMHTDIFPQTTMPVSCNFLLDRLYILINELMQGGATYKSKLNRKQVKDGARILVMQIKMISNIKYV